jgi:hypothetical protein
MPGKKKVITEKWFATVSEVPESDILVQVLPTEKRLLLIAASRG